MTEPMKLLSDAKGCQAVRKKKSLQTLRKKPLPPPQSHSQRRKNVIQPNLT